MIPLVDLPPEIPSPAPVIQWFVSEKSRSLPHLLLAQGASPAGSAPQPNYVLNTCAETVSTGDPRSALRGVDPAYMLVNYLNRDKQVVFDLASIKHVTLLQGTTHGKLVAGTSTSGRTAYRYDPTPDYIGNDQAVFMAEFEGKRYKIVVELHVFEGPATPGDFGASTCAEPTLIKVTKPSPGTSGLDLNGVAVTFAALAGGAIGETANEKITLIP